MVRITAYRLGLLGVVVASLAPLFVLPFSTAADSPAPVTCKGKVVPLADLVAKDGARLDADAGPTSLVLLSDDGKIYFLIKDNGSRLFYKDSTLLNKPVQVTGTLLPGSQIMRVFTVRTVLQGRLHDVYYWCDICTIRRGEKDICECCGGPMNLHQDPLP